MKSVVSAVLLSTLLSSTAYGLSCANGPIASLPENGMTDVPVNAQIAVWYSLSTPDDTPLFIVNQASGDVVASTTTPIEGSGDAFLFVPHEDLPANTSFYLTREVERTLTGEYPPFATFTTGEQVDELPPGQPDIMDLAKQDNKRGPWGDTDNITARVSQPGEAVYYRMELADNADFIDSEISTIYGTANDTIRVGSGPCEHTLDRDASSVKHVRITAIDLAGNESEYSESSSPVGCSSIGVSGMSAMGLGLLPFAIRRRQA